MKKLNILVVGIGLDKNTKDTVTSSLRYFVEKHSDVDLNDPCIFEELDNAIMFEDLSVKQCSHELRDSANEYGYLLTLGNNVLNKINSMSRDTGIIECNTLEVKDWGGALRERVIEQLKNFTSSWVMLEAERQVEEVAITDEHEIDWINHNLDQFKRHIQLMIQNDRPLAVHFQTDNLKSHCILRDATKKLREPINEVVPIVMENTRAREKTEKILERFSQKGYLKVFLMDIDEFMSHIRSMCLVLGGERAHIILEPICTE